MRKFTQLDVFSSRLTTGNALAVVHDADGIGDEEMAAFARWTNLSETTFLLPPTDPAADYRVRIFTPARELPFAGHPTIGSARAWLDAGGSPKAPDALVQECGAGLVRLRRDGTRLAFAAPPLLRTGPVDDADLEPVASSLGITAAQVVDAQWVDNGPGWLALLLATGDLVRRITPDLTAMSPYKVGLIGPDTEADEFDYEVRAFASSIGREDPVTGSLNAGLAQWLIGAGRAPTSYVVRQGSVIGCDGRVYVEQAGDDIWVGGDSVPGVSGTVDL